MTKEEAYDAFDEIFNKLRCGDSCCIFGRRGGMMTNGGCRTLQGSTETRHALAHLVGAWRQIQDEVQS